MTVTGLTVASMSQYGRRGEMTDQIHLRLGARPWHPADSARPGKVLNHYDVPLAGILKQHGNYFLFECLEGEVQDVNLWAYVPINRGTARKLARMTGDRLTGAMHAAYGQQSITVAFALNGRIELGECLEIRAVENSRAEAIHAVKRKAERDSSAIEGLAAAV
jgi:hypothetical protein